MALVFLEYNSCSPTDSMGISLVGYGTFRVTVQETNSSQLCQRLHDIVILVCTMLIHAEKSVHVWDDLSACIQWTLMLINTLLSVSHRFMKEAGTIVDAVTWQQ